MAAGIAEFVMSLRDMGFTLVLLWVLALSIVWGMLSHARLPKSEFVRAIISLSAAFLVMLAAAAAQATMFLQNLITSSVLVAFGIFLAIIFLEIAGIKGKEGSSFLGAHPKFFGAIILVIFVMVFIGAGGLQAIGWPTEAGKGVSMPPLSEDIIAPVLFFGVIIVAIALLAKEMKK